MLPKKLDPESVNHMFPSGPRVMSWSCEAPGIEYSFTVPSSAATPTLVPSVNHTPFGPLAIPVVAPEVGNSWIWVVPEGRLAGIIHALRPWVHATMYRVSRVRVSCETHTAGSL